MLISWFTSTVAMPGVSWQSQLHPVSKTYLIAEASQPAAAFVRVVFSLHLLDGLSTL